MRERDFNVGLGELCVNDFSDVRGDTAAVQDVPHPEPQPEIQRTGREIVKQNHRLGIGQDLLVLFRHLFEQLLDKLDI